ncbi:MAG: DNA repair protein RadC [Oscillospiraceae bacterium]|nr:DNA repair protein RadC [Oscillospiraceae bacterium]
MATASVHKGHRERLKQRFLDEGLDNFTDIQVLELLLFYAIPQKDTNPIAHALLDRFGSLSQVLEASVEELKKVDGIKDNAATLLALVTQLCRYYQVDCAQRIEILDSLEACGNYLVPRFFGRTRETVFLLCLDARCKVICCKELGEGSVNVASISIRKVVETALGANASSVVLAHNHPSGVAVPSEEDLLTTKRLYAALQAVEIVLADHIVVAEGDYVSMAQTPRYDFRVIPIY